MIRIKEDIQNSHWHKNIDIGHKNNKPQNEGPHIMGANLLRTRILTILCLGLFLCQVSWASLGDQMDTVDATAPRTESSLIPSGNLAWLSEIEYQVADITAAFECIERVQIPNNPTNSDALLEHLLAWANISYKNDLCEDVARLNKKRITLVCSSTGCQVEGLQQVACDNKRPGVCASLEESDNSNKNSEDKGKRGGPNSEPPKDAAFFLNT